MGELQAAMLDQLRDSTVQWLIVLAGLLLLSIPGKSQPTRLAFGLILLPVPFILLSFFWPWLGAAVPFYTPVLILLMLADRFLLSIPARQLSLGRDIPQSLSIGQRHPVALHVINNSRMPLQAEVRDSVPADLMPDARHPEAFNLPCRVPPFSRETLSYSVLGVRRGPYDFGRIHLRYRSGLGLLWLTFQGGRPDRVKVIPDMRRVRRLRIQASRALNAGELQKRSLGLEGTRFSGLRHYFAGDDIRKMAWQATAKLEQPVVRTYEHEVEQPILVLLDAGRKMTTWTATAAGGPVLQKFDWALNTALAFMAVALDRGDCVGAGVFSNRVLAHTPLDTGKSHLKRLLASLGDIQVEAVEPDYETAMLTFARSLKRRALVVVLTDLIDPLASGQLLHSLGAFPDNHLLMVVTLSDEALRQRAGQMPTDARQVYEKGVAMDLLEMRRRSLRILGKSRQAIVIDAPPERLDEALIQQYLQLKRQSRI